MSVRDRAHHPRVCAFNTEHCHLLSQRKGLDKETSGSSGSEEGQKVSKQELLYTKAAFLNTPVQFLQ